MAALRSFAFAVVCGGVLAVVGPQGGLAQETSDADLAAEEARQVQVAARFQSILEKNPRRGTALDRVYGHHVEFGSLGTFVDGLKARVQADPSDGAGWMILGLIESLRGEDASAVDALTRAEQTRSDDPLASYYLGQSLLLVGRPDDAVQAFERAIARQPERADLMEIFQQLGRVHQRAQRDDAARDVWSRLEQSFPDDPRVLEQIAVTLTEEGKYADALSRFERLIGLVDDDYRKTTFRVQAAELKIRENRRSEGLADLESLLADLNPESWLYRDVRRRIEDVFVRSGDQDGLVKYYEQWLASHPDDLDAMSRVASVLANSARVPEAMQWMDKALKLAPSRVDLRRAFIRQLLDDQRYAEAIQQYAQLSSAAPGNVDVLREWGRTVLKDTAQTEEARRAEATRIWNLIIAAQPDDALTAAQVADLFRQAKMNEPAIALYEQAVALAPDDPQYREYLGEFHQILGQKERAYAVWQEIASGSRRNAQNLARLAEVLNRFSYPGEAADTVAEAAQLDAKDLSLQLRAAEYHMQAQRYDAALGYIAAAERLSQNAEEADAILKQKIEVLQAADKLEAETTALFASLQDTADAPAADWHTLARYYEADREWADAAAAIQQALAKEPQSIPALTTAARIAELSGDFGRAADTFRELAVVDRRSRGDHLTNVARLEAQLGRADQALQAGRDLIVSAPGNTEHYEFYAQLCFRLGQSSDGIDALRKAVRINPTEPQLITTLASALANEFRTDEAIQLYWQAFEKSEELDDQTSLVMKLTELHLQLNQFDRLIERLERGRREEETRRAMTICLAQAHHSAGDYGTARAELESLLTTDTRDTELLLQLSKLCEAGQDFDAAVEYQRQIASLAPGPETEYRLAQLLQAQGESEQATDILSQLLLREEDPIRMLRGVDSLLIQGTYETALAVIEPLRRERRDDWELLYREGVAWAGLERADEAADRFRQILALPVALDALGVREAERFQREQTKAKSDKSRGISVELPIRPTGLTAANSWGEIRQAVGLDYDRYFYGGGSTPQTWTPGTYGQARMAAYGWLLKYAQNDGTADEFEKDVEAAAADPAAARETLIDCLYLQRLQNRYAAAFAVLQRLARIGGAEEQQFYLEALPQRGIADPNMQYSGNQPPKPPPLPPDELDFAVTCLNALLARSNLSSERNVYTYARAVTAVVKELKLADRTDQANQVLDDFASRAETVQAITSLFALCTDAEWYEPAEKLRTRWKAVARRELQQQANRGARAWMGTATGNASGSIVRMMGYYGAEKQNDAVLALLDDFTEIAIEEALVRRTQRKPRSGPVQRQGSSYYQTWYGKQVSGIQIDFPRPNEHIDSGTISVLREAYEVFQRNDVASDLLDHLDRRLQSATEDDRFFRLLFKSAVQWWQEEHDDAIATFAEASHCLPQDAGLKLELASLYEARSDFDEALSIADGIVAVDQRLLQTRETLAMQLAERIGDLERARTAAERLFGLRLDTQTQVALATHMRRLGMHDLAAAVMARADRRAGNQASSLMLLMTQYQGQGNTALAQQIAFRILQRTQGAVGQNQQVNRRRGQTQDAQSRDQALRVLAQTGALQPLIDQVEQRLQQSPGSPRLYDQLIEYYTVLGNRDKVQELLERAIAQRPNVLTLQLQLATYQQQNGKSNEACDTYLKLIKSRPEWFRDQFYEIHNVFRQAQREKELAELVTGMDLRQFGHPHYVMNIAQNLLRNEETRELGVALFEKCFDQFPSYRGQVVSNLYDAEFWKNDRIYELGKTGLLPDEASAAAQPWYGVTDTMYYSGGGTVHGMFHRMFEGIRGTPRESDLRQLIAARVKQLPAWHGGKALLALLDIHTGKKEAGVAALQTLLADDAVFNSMPTNSRWMIGQELDQLQQTRDLAIRLFNAALVDRQNMISEIEYSPVVRLVRLYGELGEKQRARDLLLSSINSRSDYYDHEYQNYLQARNGIFAAGELKKMDLPADAIRIYRGLLLQEDSLRRAGSWYSSQTDHFVNAARQGLDQTLASLTSENAESAIAELLAPPEQRAAGAAVLDLMLIVPSVNQLGERTIDSPLLKLLSMVASNPTTDAAITARLQHLAAEYPDDFAVAVTQAIWGLRHGSGAAELDRIAQLVAARPLEPVPEGRRPNSRLRAAAAERIPIWLLARECLKRPETQAVGAQLADAAIAGAQRQVDEAALAAILFEWGTQAADSGDLAEAERRWNQLLDYVTRRPQAKSKPPAQPTSWRVKIHCSIAQGARREPLGLTRRPATRPISAERTEFVAFLDDPAATPAEAQPSGKAESPQRTLIAPLTFPQFRVTIAIAREAARRKLPDLSRRAVQEALRGGPPVPIGQETNSRSRGRVIMASPVGGVMSLQQADNGDGATAEVAEAMQGVLALWDPETYPPTEVYDVLAPLVFPPQRPGEILLYPNSGGVDQLQVTSLGATFVEWAIRAGRLDDMRQAIASRQEHGMARSAALVLETQVALQLGDVSGAATALQGLNDALAANTAPEAVLLAAHAAIPALERPELTAAAVPILQRVVEQQIQAIAVNYERQPEITPLTRRINEALRAQGNTAALRRFYDSYLTCTQAYYARYSGEYGLWAQMQVVAQLSADAAYNVGPDLALEFLGRVADVTFNEQGPVNTHAALAAAACRITERSAEERYALWRDWTLPAEGRRTVRLTADEVEPVTLPPELYKLRGQTDGADLELIRRYDVLSNFGLLVEAAREANALADLKPRVKAALDEKLPNAEYLWALVLLALDDPEAQPVVSNLAATVRERRKPQEGRRQALAWGDFLVCDAALTRPEVVTAVEPLFEWLLSNESSVPGGARRRLVLDLAAAQRQAAALAAPADSVPLAWWESLDVGVSRGWEPWWTVNEGRLARLAGGSGSDRLFFKYPLTGAFEFSFDRLSSPSNGSHVGYNGAIINANGDYLHVRAAGGHEDIDRQKMGLEQRAGGYERFKVVSDGRQVRFFVADHLIYEEPVTHTSPWLHLHAEGHQTCVYRNLQLTGTPEIPRSVPLFAADRMEGWVNVTREPQRPHRLLAEPPPADPDDYRNRQRLDQPDQYTWEVADGVLTGRPRAGLSRTAAPNAQSDAWLGTQWSWLFYQRPLHDHDRVQYEFFYAPGQAEVHPALGRLAFLLRPDGVHTHWITQNGDRDLLQIPNANLMLETAYQRGGGALPLRTNDWNTFSLQVAGNVLTMELNGAAIFERPLAPEDDTRFGIFRNAALETRIRNAALSGDWPTSLPEDVSDNLLALDQPLPEAEARIAAALLQRLAPGATPDYARDILLIARRQSDAEAFETLKNWVLPNAAHDDIRLYSKHGPIAPLPPTDGIATPTREGEVLLPAWEMVTLAQRLGQLPEIAAAVENLPATGPVDRLVRDAFQVMVHAAAGEDEPARQHLAAVRENYLEIIGGQVSPISEHAALAAFWGAAERPALRAEARAHLDAMTTHLKDNKFLRPAPSFRDLNDSWTNVAAHRIADRELADAPGPESLSQWTLVATDTAPSRGLGMLPTSFRRTAGRLEHIPGQVHGQLLFQSPLTGTFEIVARGTFGRPTPLLVGYGQQAVAAIGDPYSTLSAQLMRSHDTSAGFPVADLPEISELRIAVDGNQAKYSFNGTLVREQVLSPHPDPWIALQAYDPAGRGALHSLRIEGTPTVPHEIRLLETHQLAGFRTEYFDTITLEASNERSAWQYLGEELMGRGFYYVSTRSLQSVLTYQRPLLEDGEFEFETYYVPGELEVHPCIGRTTFLLRPSGPQLHLRTDGPFERSGLLPDNASDLPGARPLPMKERDWNHVRVALSGNRATLFVNGADVAQTDVRDPRERRWLGLFRFANQTRCRVRNFIYRGHWPKSVPPVAEQELAGTAEVAAK